MENKNLKDACKKALDLGYEARKIRNTESKGEEELSYEDPDVGAVFLDKDGNIISCAYRHEIDHFHAEVSAIAKLFGDGHTDLLDKIETVISTLEPCSVRPVEINSDKGIKDKDVKDTTFPCVKYLIYYGVKKVYIGSFDSAIIVRGRGVNLLYDHGTEDDIELHTFPDKDLRDLARSLNREYNECRKRAGDKLFESWHSRKLEKRKNAMNTLLSNAIRDVEKPTIANLPVGFLNIIENDQGINKIALETKEIRGLTKNEFMDYVIANYKEKIDKVLNTPVDILYPMRYTLRDILAIHLMINKREPNLNFYIYRAFGKYFHELKLKK